jgi:hypothetical protein
MSRAEREGILKELGEEIVQEFRLRPLRNPVDANFAPSYEQFVQGDMRAIDRYCDVSATRAVLDSSFYELLGRLVTIRFYRSADIILSEIERRGVINWPSRRKTYEYWYGVLKPRCQRARQFIRAARESGSTATTGDLWREYVLRSFPIESRNDPVCSELLDWGKSHTEDSVRSRLRAYGSHGRELERLTKSSFQIDAVNKYGPWRLLPPEIFRALASSRAPLNRCHFRLTPAAAARRYACEIVRVSESWVSRRYVRKS